MHQSFLRHRNFYWVKAALALCLLALGAYLWHQPVDPPNGGTWLGYVLGGVGAGIIVWLSWFGVRKRRYRAEAGNLSAWLSAHVYLGVALVLLVTLHTGFQFGWNVHTLAYVLMLTVVLSGLYGIYAYSRYPALVTANRAGFGREALLAELAEVDEQALTLADSVGPEAHAVVLNGIERTVIGGGLWDQLSGGRRKPTQMALERLQGLAGAASRGGDAQRLAADAINVLSGQVKGGRDGALRLERIRGLSDLLARRLALVERLQRDVMYHARMELWLFLHVPFTLGLLAALLAHIVSVFFYW